MSNPALVNPDLNYALEVFGNALKYDLNCHRVGKIVKFNPDDLTCDVELLELKPNKERLTKYSIIQGLPLLISGGIDTNLTFGDVTGAECLIHFNDRDIDSWFDTGEAYKPNSKRMHDFSDGFVSLRPHNKYDNIEYEVDGTVLHKGSSKIKLTSQGVEVSVGDIPATEEHVHPNIIVKFQWTQILTILQLVQSIPCIFYALGNILVHLQHTSFSVYKKCSVFRLFCIFY